MCLCKFLFQIWENIFGDFENVTTSVWRQSHDQNTNVLKRAKLQLRKIDVKDNLQHKKNITCSVYDCTVEDVEYIYNMLSLLLLLKMCILSLL